MTVHTLPTRPRRAFLPCEWCGGRADRLLLDDPEHLPAHFPPDRLAVRIGCGCADDGAWSRVYPLGATRSRADALAYARGRRAAEARGERFRDLIPLYPSGAREAVA